METGSLRHKVTIERPIEVRGALGGTTEEFEPWLSDIWASIEPLSPSEYFAAAQVASETTVRIRIRYRPGITSKMRVRQQLGGGSPTLLAYYDIEGEPLDIFGRRREIHLMCKKREAQGFRHGGDAVASAPAPDPGDAPSVDSTLVTGDSSTITADAA